MTTLDLKVWLATAFFATATAVSAGNGLSQSEMVCINTNRVTGQAAFMDGQRHVYHLDGIGGWQDGDCGTVTVDASGNVVFAEEKGYIWRYAGNGYFPEVHYPWWYTGNRPTEIKVNPTPMK